MSCEQIVLCRRRKTEIFGSGSEETYKSTSEVRVTKHSSCSSTVLASVLAWHSSTKVGRLAYHSIFHRVWVCLLALWWQFLFTEETLLQLVNQVMNHWMALTSPQAIWNEATTRSPFFSPFTAGPISSTIPQNSWPRISPFSSCTTLPCKRCKSLPQTVDPVIFRITSRSSTTLGFGTSSDQSCEPLALFEARKTYPSSRSSFHSILELSLSHHWDPRISLCPSLGSWCLALWWRCCHGRLPSPSELPLDSKPFWEINMFAFGESWIKLWSTIWTIELIAFIPFWWRNPVFHTYCLPCPVKSLRHY